MFIKLSKTKKMPCKSFSLPVREEICKGMIDLSTNDMKDVCKGCYAKKGFYNMPTVTKPREDNYTLSMKIDFTENMIKEINNDLYFRWFDSGDIYSQEFLEKVLEVCKKTPYTNHWIPTKSRDLFSNKTWRELEALSNVKVRFSSPNINGHYANWHGSTVYTDNNQLDSNTFACKATTVMVNKKNKKGVFELKPRGTCDNCRACWHNDKVIAYKLH